MNQRETLAHRRRLRFCLMDIRTAISDMLTYWEDNDLPSDILADDEYPFTMSLDELHSEVVAAFELIRVRDEAALEALEAAVHKPPTMTKRDLIDALENLDCPDDTPILAYSEVSEYLNVTEISNTDFEAGPALVIETLDNYDSRQW